MFADKEYEDEQEKMQKETIEKYREWRQSVLEAREADQLKRDNLKKAQLRKAIKIQVKNNNNNNMMNYCLVYTSNLPFIYYLLSSDGP